MMSAHMMMIQGGMNCSCGLRGGGWYPNCNQAGKWTMSQATGLRQPAGVPSGVLSQASQWGNESNMPALVPTTRASVMTPMVFWASFMPWAKPM